MARLAALWRNLLHRNRTELDLDAELNSWLESIVEEKVRAGLDPQLARREARLELGGVEQVKESVRDVRAGRTIERCWSDFRHAWRMISKMPLTAVVVVASLGVGIGVNTAVFSWIQAVVFQPLPGVAESGSYYHVEPRTETGAYPGMSWLEFQDVRMRAGSFRDLLAYRMTPFYEGEAGRTTRVYGLLVSGNYFGALALRPAAGRFIESADPGWPGSGQVVVISYDFWQTRFGGSAGAIGQTIRLNAQQLTVIGVTPPRFQGTVLGMNFTFWVPATMAPLLFEGSKELEDRSLRGYAAMGRLRRGVTHAAAQIELNGAMAELARIYPETNGNIRAEAIPFWQAPRGPQRLLAESLTILQGVLILLLLAVCGNTASLMLARTSARQREIGVRLAIGAGPGRVMSLLLTENVLLASLGAALGVAIAIWGTVALRAVPIVGAFPIRFRTGVDAGGLGFAVFLGLACGVAFGLPPALELSRLDPQSALRGTAGKGGRGSLRDILVGVQLALALLVLIVAGLFFRGFRETRDADPGFRRDGILVAGYDLAGRNYDPAAARTFAIRLLERIRALPFVEGVAIASSVPLDIHGMPSMVFTAEGHAGNNATPPRALTNTVTPGYFETMGIPVLRGRDFADLKNADAPMEAVVNEEFVRRYLGKAEPVGRQIGSQERGYKIVGVVRDSTYESFGERPAAMIYLSYRDRPWRGGQIHIRTRAGAELRIGPDLTRIVRGLDPSLDVFDVRSMNEHVEKNAILRSIPARMFAVLGPLLLALAAIGIYAVVACSVAQRTTEIGVRLALGATPGRVAGQMARETLRVVSAGLLAGWLVAFVVDIHIARGVLYLPVFVGVPAALMAVAWLACWLPARRAGGIDPMAALRRE